jgi:F1F0 ATPase subunit 2
MLTLALYAGCVFAGFLAGLFFFGGLRLTVAWLPRMRQPAVLMLASWILRTFVVLALFYFISAGDWRRILIMLAGFVIARFAAVWYWGAVPPPEEAPQKE